MLGARIPKRIGAFNPLSVQSLEVWLEGDDPAQADNTELQTWTDRKRAVVFTVPPLSGVKRFRQRTNVLNGLAIVRTSPTGAPTATPPGSMVLSVADSASLRVAEYSAVILARRTPGSVRFVNSGTAGIGVVGDAPTGDGWQVMGYGGGGVPGTVRGYSVANGVPLQVNYLGDNGGNWAVRSQVRDAGGETRAYLNGVQVGTSAAAIGAIEATAVLNIGCGRGWGEGAGFANNHEGLAGDHDYASIMLFNGALPEGVRRQLERWIGTRWGIAVA